MDKLPTEALIWAANEARTRRDNLLAMARDAARSARMYDQMLAARAKTER